MQHRKLMIYLCCVHTLACVCFFFGFLPLKSNVEKKKVVYNVTRVSARYTHLVIVLIDALRTDFVFNKDQTLMPFLQEMIRNNQTYR